MSDRMRVTCPCCQAELVIDAVTATVLSHRAKDQPPAGGKTLEGLFAAMEEGQARAAERFDREQAAHQERERLLAAKFDEALARARETTDEAPPKRPFDLD